MIADRATRWLEDRGAIDLRRDAFYIIEYRKTREAMRRSHAKVEARRSYIISKMREARGQ